MSFLSRPLLSLYQNNRTAIHQAVSAAWLSSLIWFALGGLPAYPDPWRAVIAAAVLTVGLWTGEWAFYIAVLALLYPLYQISIYVMILFLAAAVLLRPLIIAHFNQTLLIVSVSLLAQVHLEAVPALLAGLLWGAGGGMWVGGLAALWLKLLGGMSGLDIDLGVLISTPLDVSLVMDRFHAASSLETLQRLVEPFAPSSTLALSHLLQILGWGMAGYVVGGMARRGWMEEKGMLGRAICLIVGAVLFLAGTLWVPVWLELRAEEEVMAQVTPIVMDSLFAISAVALLDGCRRLLNRLPPARQRRKPIQEPAESEEWGGESRERRVERKSPKSALPQIRKAPEPALSDQDDDIIMIELD